jgi:hypothetical protein
MTSSFKDIRSTLVVSAVTGALLVVPLPSHASTNRSGRTQLEPSFAISHKIPHAGHIFVGIGMTLPQPKRFTILALSCDAKVGGHLSSSPSGVVFSGGRHLRPILYRVYTAPDSAGRRYLERVRCGWRLPFSAARKLLSLVPPPGNVPCDTSCKPWGFYVKYTIDGGDPASASDTMLTQVTWRVRR